jgi:ribosomal protein S18 acetylase RimI-like enzyme
MIFFKKFDLYYQLTTPGYELPVFGHKVGELRLVNNSENQEYLPFSDLIPYLITNDINICTFRGKEDIGVIRTLESVGFKFVSSYNTVECTKEGFTEIKNSQAYKVTAANIEDFNEILEIEKCVQDYSTFSVDPLIDRKIASERNMIRVKSHFNKTNHRIYIVKIKNRIAGFIQFDVDLGNSKAYTLNAAIHPDFQKMDIGKSLFSYSFKSIFSEGCNIIFSDYSIQNIGSTKLHDLCNFKTIEREIHLRYFNKKN